MRLLSALRARLFGDGDGPDQAEQPPDAPVEAEMTADEQPASDEGLPAESEVVAEAPSAPDDSTLPSDAVSPEAAGSAFADAVPSRQERAAGRILDDEGLRGDLTDDEYQPLLEWALTVTDQLAAATADLNDEQAEAALDGGLQVVRDALRAAQDAIVALNEGRTDDQQVALDDARAAIAALPVETPEMPLPALAEAPPANQEPESAEIEMVVADAEAESPELEREADS